MIAVIMAGGKGTRLRAITKGEIPKPMVEVAGKPILEWQIEQLKKYGIDEVIMVVGNLSDKITEYFGDGSGFGIGISYIVEKEALGTAGALFYLKDELARRKADEFLMVFGDLFFDFDIDRMIDFHHKKNAVVTLLSHPNAHPFDSDLIVTDGNEKVTAFDSKHNDRTAYWYDNCVNAGIYVMSAQVTQRIKAPVKTDLEHDVLADMVNNKEEVYAYRTPEFVRDIGTVERIEQTVKDIERGLVEKKNLRNKQRAIFLDRDGVINEYASFITDIDKFKLYENTAEAIKKINSSGYLAIVISNQPVIARGELTKEELELIHKKMKSLLGNEGAYIDEIYYCPHHPDSGYEGEVKELKIDCACRKPKPGMIFAARDRFNIDLENSWMIGDMTGDILTGNNAGTHTALVKTGIGGQDGKYKTKEPDIIADDILDAVEMILNE